MSADSSSSLTPLPVSAVPPSVVEDEGAVAGAVLGSLAASESSDESSDESEAEAESGARDGSDSTTDFDDENEEADLVDSREAPLTDHLSELRRRIITCLICWVAGTALCYCYSDSLLQKIRSLASDNFYFVFTSPTEAFMAFIKLSMLVSFFLCLPLVIYHALAFICPGLTKRERKWLLRLVPFTIVLMVSGCLFGWYIALPIMWKFFLGFQSEGVRALWSIGEVVSFVVGLLLMCGLVFQTPLVLIFLAALGLVKPQKLAEQRRMVYFGAFFVSAVLTPTPDAFTAGVIAIPLIVFFELSLSLMKLLRLG